MLYDGEVCLGGGIIDAKEAHRIGMVNAVFPHDSFAAASSKRGVVSL